MAFNSIGLNLGRGGVNDNASTENLATHTYKSDDDNMAAITAEGYFPAYLGADENIVQVGDILEVLDSEKVCVIYQITDVSPIELSAQATPVNEVVTFDVTLTGALSMPYTIYAEKIGTMVNLNFPDAIGESENPGLPIGASGIPEEFRPSSVIYSAENGLTCMLTAINNSVIVTGSCTVYTDGTFAFGPDVFGDYTTGQIGAYNFSVTFRTD